MKKILILFGFLLATLTSFSQKKVDVKVNGGIQTFIPTGELNTTHYFGLGMTAEIESLPKNSDVGYLVYSGYNYILGRGNNQSLIQFPALIGLRFYFNDIVSLTQVAGASFYNQGIGFKFTYIPSFRYEFNTLTIDCGYQISFIEAPQKNMSGVILRAGYTF